MISLSNATVIATREVAIAPAMNRATVGCFGVATRVATMAVTLVVNLYDSNAAAKSVLS